MKKIYIKYRKMYEVVDLPSQDQTHDSCNKN